eukprot:scaffold56194_cov73-Phaeocystis_antarctica.AAC.1
MELQGLLFRPARRKQACILYWDKRGRCTIFSFMWVRGERAYRICISLIFRVVNLHACGDAAPIRVCAQTRRFSSGVARAAASCTGGVKRRVLQHTGGVRAEHAYWRVSWGALTLEVGKSPTEVPPGRRRPVAPLRRRLSSSFRRRA